METQGSFFAEKESKIAEEFLLEILGKSLTIGGICGILKI